MKNYTELIKALRCCCPQPEETCDGCPYDTAGECNISRMMFDAAAAIEALQAEVEILKVSGREAYFEGLAADDNGRQVKELAKRNAELHAELQKWVSAAEQAGEPKRGKWVEDTTTYAGPGLSNYKCSLCGKIGGTWRRGLKPSELPNWCGNCGADMRKMEWLEKEVSE